MSGGFADKMLQDAIAGANIAQREVAISKTVNFGPGNFHAVREDDHVILFFDLFVGTPPAAAERYSWTFTLDGFETFRRECDEAATGLTIPKVQT